MAIPPHPSPPPDSERQVAGEQLVHARRFDDFTWAGRFAYIKIDVEGAEQLVLSGSKQLLQHRAPMVWSFEYVDTQQRLGSSMAALLEAFAQESYSFYLYRPGLNRLVPFIPDASDAYPAREVDNVLAIHTSAIDQVARWLCVAE